MWAFIVISTAFLIECVSPALYYIISFVIPVVMTAHCTISTGFPGIGMLCMTAVSTVLLIGIAMSVCLHRYFSHRAFDTSRIMQFVLGVIACLAWQGGPLQWAHMHIKHHKFCDRPNDPHSVKHGGFWYAFLGWMGNPANYAYTNAKYLAVDYRLRTADIYAIQKFHMIPPLTLCIFVQHTVGYQEMVFTCVLPMVLCRFITLLFNVEFHPIEGDFSKCLAIDNKRILAMVVGESLHSEHHCHPRQAHRGDLDIPYWLTIFWLEKCHLVWNCR